MKRFVSKELINKGWSEDIKYCVTDETGERYLLRISSKDKYDRKKAEFDMMRVLEAQGVPMCLPIEFGECSEGIYSLQSFIDGADARELLPTLSETEIYSYGLEAGRILKLIHNNPAPADAPDWDIRYNKKADNKIQRYLNCPIKYENGDLFIDYINSSRALLKNRPQTYHHGDYHNGNMMIGKDKKLYIIDFDRYDRGDPWEEFGCITWCAQTTPQFAVGMIDGYFGGEAPEEFWSLLRLYISCGILSSLPWSIPFGEEETEVFKRQAKDILGWYSNTKTAVPSWYHK